MVKQTPFRKTLDWLLLFVRILVGGIILKTGYDLAANNLYISPLKEEGFLTGLFIGGIGVYVILTSLTRKENR